MKDSRKKNAEAVVRDKAEQAYTMKEEVSCSPEFPQGCVEAENER